MRSFYFKRDKPRGPFFYACCCFAFSALLILYQLFFLSSKPSIVEGALIVTDGELYAVTAGSQYSTSFIVREKDGGLTKFTALPIYTDLNEELRSHRGDRISVSHYGKLVVECQIYGAQFCSPKCFSDYGCRMKLYESDMSTFRHVSYTVFFVGVGFLLGFAYQCRGHKR